MLVKTVEDVKTHRCLSCGKTDNKRSRRYCSVKCRQNLRQKLNVKNGLLQALNTRYATFYFSDKMIILDIVPYGFKEIFRYTEKRTKGNPPAIDFNAMTNHLGDVWWAESRRTQKNYLASQQVLRLAKRYAITDGSHRPKLIRVPSVNMASLNYLEIQKADLHSRDLNTIIKNAFRRQVKIHHPDLGGQAAAFRQIHAAYKELLRWADNPVFIRRKGFPDKWFYSGENKKWVQPTPMHE